MSGEPTVWHYGLMAERWELITEAPELPFLERFIQRIGEPVLDLACGTGRLLVPLKGQGIDIHGCDLSQDMLGHCRRRATAAGIDLQLC